MDTAAVRILDVSVLSALSSFLSGDVTVTKQQLALFDRQWVEVNITAISDDSIDKAWTQFSALFFNDFAVEPVYYNACAQGDACVGVKVTTGECVCYV